MYLKAILGYLSWPLLIIFSYLLVRWALNKFESHVAMEEQTGGQPGEHTGSKTGGQTGGQTGNQLSERSGGLSEEPGM